MEEMGKTEQTKQVNDGTKQVNDEIESLSKAVNNLSGNMLNLREALNSVMRQPEPSDAKDKCVREEICPLATGIRAIKDTVGESTEVCVDILNRLEVR